MSGAGEKLGWEEFCAHVSSFLGPDVGEVGRRDRPVALADSIELVSMIPWLVDELGVRSIERLLDKQDWVALRQVTFGDLFSEYQRGAAPVKGPQIVIRTRPPR